MAMMTMSMSGYYNPHPYSSSNRDGAQRRLDPGTGSTDNDDVRYKRTTWEWESNNDDGNDNKPVRNRENHPHATSSAAAAAEVDAEFGFGSIVPTAKKRRTSESEHRFSLRPRSQSHAHHYQYHPYPYHQMQNQNSSYLQGSWNEERSASAFAGIVYNEAAPATSSATSYKESGTRTRPSQSWHHNPPEQTQNEQGSDLFSDTSIQNLYPNLPHPHHPFQVFPPPSHTEQLTLESNRTLGIVDRHPPHPPSPPRHQFGDEYYMSPIRPSLSPVQVKQVKDTPPAASAVDTKEMKVKANSDNNDGVENSVNLPPDLPNLQVNGDVAAAHTRTTNKATTTSSRNQNIWDRKFDELLEFKQQHGHTDVPQTYAPNPSLGLWVNKQRMEHKNRDDGNISTLTDERLERLEGIGFRWAKRRGQVRWDEKYNELLQYAAKFGNCHVPTKFRENTALGRWVSTQRAEYKKFCKGQKSSMNNEKIRRLDSIGFAWFMAL